MRFPELVLVAACLSLGTAVASPTPTSIVESHLKDCTILTASVPRLSGVIVECTKENERKSPEYVYAVLAGGRADANAIAPVIVTAAIQGLSTPPSKLLISQIIEASVRATPDAVLKIVRAAVLATPDEDAVVIVRAAVMSLPSVDAPVDSLSDTRQASLRGFKDFKQVREYKEYKDVAEPEDSTLPEKIVNAAQQAKPYLDLTSLETAANKGLDILTYTPPDNNAHYVIWPTDATPVSQ